jgi:hypothetical protein
MPNASKKPQPRLGLLRQVPPSLEAAIDAMPRFTSKGPIGRNRAVAQRGMSPPRASGPDGRRRGAGRRLARPRLAGHDMVMVRSGPTAAAFFPKTRTRSGLEEQLERIGPAQWTRLYA